MRFSVAKNQQFTVTKQTEPTTASSQFICCGQENTIHFYSIDISAFSTFENTFDTVILTMGKVFSCEQSSIQTQLQALLFHFTNKCIYENCKHTFAKHQHIADL